MRTKVFIVLPLISACLSECVQHTTVLGTYYASYPNSVAESIQLWRDGTYDQNIGDKTGQVIEHTGQWRIGQHGQVEVPGWIDPDSIALGRPDAGASRSDIIFLAPLADFRQPQKPINAAY
jgi:hypothetical protein